MFVATLLSSPSARRLDPAAVEAVRNAWGGGEVTWLSPDVAAEFPIEKVPSNRWQVWEDMQAMDVDLVVQRTERRRKKMLLAEAPLDLYKSKARQLIGLSK